MAQSASERRGAVANEKTWELLNSLKKIAEGPGGLFDIIKQMEGDTAENMNSEEILSKYSDALYILCKLPEATIMLLVGLWSL